MASRHWDQINLPPFGLLCCYGGCWRWLILALILGGVAALLCHAVCGLGVLGGALALAWFFRSPCRVITPVAGTVLSPVERGGG